MIGYPLDSHVVYDEYGVPTYDRAITSAPLRSLITKLFSDGVMPNPSTNMQVTAGDGMTVNIAAGFAISGGCMKLSKGSESVTLEASDTSMPRIDTIVLRLDDNDAVRSLEFGVVTGTPATSPVAPELTRSETIWEIGLANVKVVANSTQISNSNINDTRYDTSRCGIISSISQFDTSTLYLQIQTDLAEFKEINEQDFTDWTDYEKNLWQSWISTNEADFLAWYQRMKDQLSQDAAGNLQLQIDGLSGRIDDVEAEMPFAGGSKININFEYDVVPNMQYSNEHYKLTVGDTVRENNFSSSQLHFDEYGILTVGDGILEVTYDITDLRTGKITHASYTYTINMPYFGRFAYNVTISANIYGYEDWLLSIGKDPSQYPTIEDVFADEKLLRELMTRHASVDYLVEWLASNNEDAHTVLNNDYCAKWINLRDYALDMLYANPTVKAVMDEVDKYGYGEWALVGQVPKMTSNTSPMGEAISGGVLNSTYANYYAFDADNTTRFNGVNSSDTNYVGYKFTKPVKINHVSMDVCDNLLKDFIIQGSNDGTNWDDVYSNTAATSNTNSHNEISYSFHNDKEYLYWRLYSYGEGYISGQNNLCSVWSLQFYAWQPKGAVPVMTSNTAPYGEASASSATSNYEAYKAFNNDYDTLWASSVSDITNARLQYKFTNPICVQGVKIKTVYSDSLRLKTFSILGSNNGTDWDTLREVETLQNVNEEQYERTFANNKYYTYIAIGNLTTYQSDIEVRELQFYGRQLNVSVPKMTSNTTPWGEAISSSVYSDTYTTWKAFNGVNESAGWVSSTNDTFGNAYVGYDFKKDVVIKSAKVYQYNQATYRHNFAVKLQSSLDGTNWTDASEQLIVESSGIEYTFNIDNLKVCRYLRMLLLSMSSEDSGATITTHSGFHLQFYGLDYSEREFAEGSTMKYLYDHGIELSPFEYHKGSTSDVVENRTYELYISKTTKTTSVDGRCGIGSKVDLTPYSLARITVGDMLTTQLTYSMNSQSLVAGGEAYVYLPVSDQSLPSNLSVDVSGVNKECYVAMVLPQDIGIATATELWLE